MDSKKFDDILKQTLTSCERTLSCKAKEYAKGDRLYNFKRAAERLRVTPERALLGMMEKHSVSVVDMIEDPDTLYGKSYIDEKIGDHINYLILLKGLLYERYGYATHSKIP